MPSQAYARSNPGCRRSAGALAGWGSMKLRLTSGCGQTRLQTALLRKGKSRDSATRCRPDLAAALRSPGSEFVHPLLAALLVVKRFEVLGRGLDLAHQPPGDCPAFFFTLVAGDMVKTDGHPERPGFDLAFQDVGLIGVDRPPDDLLGQTDVVLELCAEVHPDLSAVLGWHWWPLEGHLAEAIDSEPADRFLCQVNDDRTSSLSHFFSPLGAYRDERYYTPLVQF